MATKKHAVSLAPSQRHHFRQNISHIRLEAAKVMRICIEIMSSRLNL